MNNKKVSRLLLVISILFIALIVHITVFDLVHHKKYAATNTSEREQYVRRGSISDRNGVVLAESTGNLKNQQRVYPYKNLYAHIVGYKSPTHDTSDLERVFNGPLMGESNTAVIGSVVTLFEDAKYALNGESEKKGSNLTLTIDHRLQQAAHDALGSYKGSVVLMNPKTGEIYAMISKPDFDPTVATLNETIANATDSALTRRATTGLYMPGSTFKIIVTASMIDNNMRYFEITKESQLKTDVTNYGNKKDIEEDIYLENAFKNSNNIYFAEAAIELGREKLLKTAEDFGFTKNISLDGLSVSTSTLPDVNSLDSYRALSNTALGQGQVATSPLHMAMIASTIANDGVMMQPYIVSKISKPSFLTTQPVILKRCISTSTAQKIKTLMKLCVDEGTGTGANISGRDVCGKTGTAEVDTSARTAHAHFVGFAPYDNPQVAIAVVLENVPDKVTGGKNAVPIARTILSKFFELYG